MVNITYGKFTRSGMKECYHLIIGAESYWRLIIIKPRRACAARVTVVVLCVCVFVCLFVRDYSRTTCY